MKSPWRALLLTCAGALALAGPGAAQPLGLPPLPAPPAALVALGKQLFFERRLSINETLSCAMCHVPAQGFTVNELKTSVGMEGISLRRNAPTLLNVAYVRKLFVDGRAASLEAQALQPIVHPDELAHPDMASAMRRLAALPEYKAPFRRAFGSARPTPARVAAALAAYERTLLAGDSPFDRWHYGKQADALGEQARRGFALFVQHGCAQCHPIGTRDALFSDGLFHNTGVQARSDAQRGSGASFTLVPGLQASFDHDTLRRIGVPDLPDLGRYEVTRRERDKRAFRTPGLRNVALTAPYMHDGSFDTLEAVIDFYAGGGWPGDARQDPRIQPFRLAPEERSALVEFLVALTSPAARSTDP
ncbi:cytochrome-c peroxidase [Piscinibacter sp.]|uniref:cytochrome-c peroxidase n=1 Tax=Piscinibacter sp. TaxID=1903157 RepID=UPI0039E64E81